MVTLTILALIQVLTMLLPPPPPPAPLPMPVLVPEEQTLALDGWGAALRAPQRSTPPLNAEKRSRDMTPPLSLSMPPPQQRPQELPEFQKLPLFLLLPSKPRGSAGLPLKTAPPSPPPQSQSTHQKAMQPPLLLVPAPGKPRLRSQAASPTTTKTKTELSPKTAWKAARGDQQQRGRQPTWWPWR